MARGGRNKALERIRGWTRRISLPGIVAALAGAAVATAVSRATGAGWLTASGLAVLLGFGLYLWAQDKLKGWGDLGEGIVVSAIVAIAIMAVQRDADTRREDLIRDAEVVRQKAAEREGLQLSLTMEPDLRGIVLAERDLRNLFLPRRDFSNADLHGADLEGADLHGSTFRNTDLRDANLDRAKLDRADLRRAVLSGGDRPGKDLFASFLSSASLRRAQLPKADLRRAELGGVDFTGAVLALADLRRADGLASFRNTVLIQTDFRGASFSDADLRGATLGGAQFCGADGLRSVRLAGARYDKSTRWPLRFDPDSRGARQVDHASSYVTGFVYTSITPRLVLPCAP